MKKLILAFLILIFSTANAQDDFQQLQEQVKSDPQNVDLLLKLGIAYHDKATTGDKKSVKKGDKILTQVLELDKENSVALAYAGSILTMKGRDALLPWKKMKDVEQGVDKIDKAVLIAADNLTIRMVRAMNSISLPSMFHRLKYSLKDFKYIINSGEFKYWPKEEQAEVYYNFGLACKKDEKMAEAQINFALTIQVAPDSFWADKAKAEME